MAKVEKYICDECGAERKEANHWFAVEQRVERSDEETRRGDRYHVFAGMSAYTWDEYTRQPDLDEVLDIHHICGEKCLHAYVSKWANQAPGKTDE